jgi:hypothetical protein
LVDEIGFLDATEGSLVGEADGVPFRVVSDVFDSNTDGPIR